ncbi:MAG: N-acyl homoserine lactonase family protein, partial [Candidatus Bathyarchaeia archaeon]
MPVYRIIPLPLIKIEIDKGVMTYRINYGEKIWIPVYMWYLDGGGKRVLVDTGCYAEFVRDYRGLPAEEIQSFDDALNSIGLTY